MWPSSYASLWSCLLLWGLYRSRSADLRGGGEARDNADGASDSSAAVAAAAAAAARAAAARKAAGDDAKSTFTRLVPAASKIRTTYAPVITGQDAVAAAAAAADARSKLAQSLNAMFQPPPPSSPPPPSALGEASSGIQPPQGSPSPLQPPPPAARQAITHAEADRIARRLFINNIPPGESSRTVPFAFCGYR